MSDRAMSENSIAYSIPRSMPRVVWSAGGSTASSQRTSRKRGDLWAMKGQGGVLDDVRLDVALHQDRRRSPFARKEGRRGASKVRGSNPLGRVRWEAARSGKNGRNAGRTPLRPARNAGAWMRGWAASCGLSRRSWSQIGRS